MAFDKIVGVDGTTYQFPTLVRTRISDNIKQAGSAENLAVLDALSGPLAGKASTSHNHNLADLNNNGIDKLGDVEIGVVGPNGIALDDKHTLQYEASTSTWRNKVASGGVTVGDSRPTSPIPGDAWFDSNDGTLYVYYADANTTQWVQVKANSALEGTILSRLGALESRATALEATPDYAPNAIINSAFDIAQRNSTHVNAPSGQFFIDRWYGRRQAAEGNIDFSRQTVTGLAGIQYAVRMGRSSGATTTGYFELMTSLETADSTRYAGKTVTVSFYARKGVNFSAASSTLNSTLYTGTGTDQSIQNGYTGATAAGSTSITLTTSWQRFSYTVAVGSTATELGVHFSWTPAGTAGASDYIELTGVQLEEGSVPTTFRRNAPSLQAELATCQRYYFKFTQVSHVRIMGIAYSWSGGENVFTMALPVNMRTEASSVSMSNVSSALFLSNNTNYTGASLSTGYTTANTLTLVFTISTGLNLSSLFRPTTGTTIEANAEL